MRFVSDWSHVLVWLLVLASAASLISFFLYLPRAGGVDELGLFNPIYMMLHYGRMTYPVHYFPDTMVVHPPLHYAEVAALMAAGMSLFHAESFAVTFLALLLVLTIGCARFQAPVKVGLLFGFLAALTFYAGRHPQSPYGLRPDVQVAVAWFAGLLLLEDGRLRGWDPKWMAAGAFVVTYASGLHYFAVVGFLAVAAYAVLAWRSQPAREWRKTLGWMAAGGCAFGLPYLALFVIPDFAAILKVTGEVQSAGGPLAPVVKHFDHYRYWLAQNALFRFGLTPFDIAYPALFLRVPLFLAGSLLLLTHRDTRGIAWGSLPLCVFVFTYSQGKSAGYFLPEFLVYFSGVGVAIATGLAALFRRWPSRVSTVAPVALMVCLTVVTVANHNELLSAASSRAAALGSEMDVARAASKQLVGDDAIVGGRIGLWYVSGATHWYNIESDLLWRPDISGVDLTKYFSAFDYVAEHGHMSNTTVNERMESVPSWIASGQLNVSGFFFSASHPESNFVLLRPGSPGRLAGFLSEELSLTRFEESAQGPLVFVSMACGFEKWPADNRFDLEGFTALLMPKADADDPSRSILPHAAQGDPQLAVVAGILDQQQFALRWDEMHRACRMLNVVQGGTRPVDRDPLLAQFRRSDRTMRFYRDYDAVVDSTTPKAPVAGPAPDLGRIEKMYAKASIEGTGPVRVLTGPEQWSFAAYLPIDFSSISGGKGWVAVTAEVAAGTVGFGVFDRDSNAYLTRRFVGAREARDGDVLLRVDEGADGLMIENGAPGGSPSAVTIEGVRIFVPLAPGAGGEQADEVESDRPERPLRELAPAL